MGMIPAGAISGAAISGRAVEALSQAANAVAGLASAGGGLGEGDACIAIPTDGATGPSPYDRVIDGLNRLPRPFLAMGTLGLFVYAMADPAGFSARMRGLAEVPEPLWWLFGAVVSFHFGAREAHYHRVRRAPRLADPPGLGGDPGGIGAAGGAEGDPGPGRKRPTGF